MWYNKAMSDTLLGSIIGAVVALIVCLVTNWTQRKKDAVAQAKRDQKLDDQIETMNHKLDEHNRYSDKIASMEKAIVRTDTRLDNIEKALTKK